MLTASEITFENGKRASLVAADVASDAARLLTEVGLAPEHGRPVLVVFGGADTLSGESHERAVGVVGPGRRARGPCRECGRRRRRHRRGGDGDRGEGRRPERRRPAAAARSRAGRPRDLPGRRLHGRRRRPWSRITRTSCSPRALSGEARRRCSSSWRRRWPGARPLSPSSSAEVRSPRPKLWQPSAGSGCSWSSREPGAPRTRSRRSAACSDLQPPDASDACSAPARHPQRPRQTTPTWTRSRHPRRSASSPARARPTSHETWPGSSRTSRPSSAPG